MNRLITTILVTFLTLYGSKPSYADSSKKSSIFNINRLQARYTENNALSFTQSVFIRSSVSQLFLLEVFEHTEAYDDKEAFNLLEINTGGALFDDNQPYRIGWVARAQNASHSSTVYSLGMQFNLSNLESIKNLARKYKLNTFVQVFPFKNNDSFGDYDLLHYYSLRLYGKLSVRGTNAWYHFNNEKNYVRALADFIYPLNRHFDVYTRYVYQNRDEVRAGELGSEWSIGFRYNFKW
ncbi:secreted protein [Candidatus Thiomargarita nelsonii]|uniref:Secreted protein n=1 Tax=Candidatus Thiomargarita nelsonii TaxID=1003181 RepID=A0A176S7V0_9GAMM|nr:secreted protein [Candidatus Thiomargarita nelsonii]